MEEFDSANFNFLVKIRNGFTIAPEPFLLMLLDTFDGAKPRFVNRGKKRRSVSTLSPSAVLGTLSLSKGIPRASDRGVERVDSFYPGILFFDLGDLRTL